MRAFRFLFKDWVFGIILTLAMLTALSLELYPLRRVEFLAYDFMSRFLEAEGPGSVAIVGIDEKSQEKLGKWPWPRTYVADMVDHLSEFSPRVIGLDLLYPDNELNPGLKEIRAVTRALGKETTREAKKVYRSLKRAERSIDGDGRMVSSVRSSGRVVLPLLFTLGIADGEQGKVPGFVERNSILLDSPPGNIEHVKADILALKNPLNSLLKRNIEATGMRYPFDGLASKARSMGHINKMPDRGGIVRSEPLFIQYGRRFYPSLALQLALSYLNIDLRSLKRTETSKGTRGLSFKELEIFTDREFQIFPRFRKEESFPVHSFSDVLEGTVQEKQFKDRVVLIGLTGERDRHYRTPGGEPITEALLTANLVSNIIRGDQIVRPGWAFALEVAIIFYFGIFVSFILPRVGLKVGALLTALSLLPICITWGVLFLTSGYWIMLFSPSLLLLLGYFTAVSREFVSFGRKSAARQEKNESNKLLGLSFQSKGMLDHAFEKFMACPVRDTSVRELLYNLALDFERKRMPGKARAVYEHILKAGKFKDVKERFEKIGESERASMPGSGSSHRDNTVFLEGLGANPTLGRYEILKELGRGAMGMVFLGRDPKINRKVAIKTLVYGEVENEQLENVKKRFFQEAMAAGKLSHPNIMTIYDAGEEHDMAFMAMELLSGSDLTQYCRKGNLLPRAEAVRIAADVAEALDYAHKKGVIHRDIKPANIMLLDDGTVKVTDFGIARIVESSTTHTGMIQGTPSYMSPEQVQGETVTGSSDLFSLGSVIYELISGEKAFKGDTISSVMYRITKGDYVPLEKAAKKIPDRLDRIVKKLLARSVVRRYKTGADAAVDLKALLNR